MESSQSVHVRLPGSLLVVVLIRVQAFVLTLGRESHTAVVSQDLSSHSEVQNRVFGTE